MKPDLAIRSHCLMFVDHSCRISANVTQSVWLGEQPEISTKIARHSSSQTLCRLLSERHASPHQAVPTPRRWGMVIHSSHMQIVPVRLGRPWERIKASGLGSPSISPSSLPPPLYRPLSCRLAMLFEPLDTPLSPLPRAELQSLECAGC